MTWNHLTMWRIWHTIMFAKCAWLLLFARGLLENLSNFFLLHFVDTHDALFYIKVSSILETLSAYLWKNYSITEGKQRLTMFPFLFTFEFLTILLEVDPTRRAKKNILIKISLSKQGDITILAAQLHAIFRRKNVV